MSRLKEYCESKSTKQKYYCSIIASKRATGSATGGGFHGESSVGMEGSLSAKSDGLSMVVGVVVCMGCCRFGGMATGEVRGKCEDRVE